MLRGRARVLCGRVWLVRACALKGEHVRLCDTAPALAPLTACLLIHHSKDQCGSSQRPPPVPVARQVSGAPVVSDSGQLIANLSISDLRALTSEHFGVLALPVAEFLVGISGGGFRHKGLSKVCFQGLTGELLYLVVGWGVWGWGGVGGYVGGHVQRQDDCI